MLRKLSPASMEDANPRIEGKHNASGSEPRRKQTSYGPGPRPRRRGLHVSTRAGHTPAETTIPIPHPQQGLGTCGKTNNYNNNEE
jgi:hypothetical protein